MSATEPSRLSPMPQRRLGHSDLRVSALGAEDLARINRELPPGITAGDRYNSIGMARLNR